jgi:hypothetical protein
MSTPVLPDDLASLADNIADYARDGEVAKAIRAAEHLSRLAYEARIEAEDWRNQARGSLTLSHPSRAEKERLPWETQ